LTIDLRKCSQTPVHLQRAFDVRETFEPYPELAQLDSADLDLNIAAAGARRFSVRGSVRAEGTAYCGRCLTSFSIVFDRRFEQTALPETAPGVGDEAEVKPEQVDVIYYVEERLDVMPILTEQIILCMPMRYLCAEDCRGLCSQCGTNQNERPCSCDARPFKSSLEGLSKLLD